MKYKKVLVILVLLAIVMISSGIGITYAYYKTEITGAVTGSTAAYSGEIEIGTGTHTNLVPASTAIDSIDFYIKNYSGTDSSAKTSEVYLSYVLTFTPPTWGTGCTNPVSFKLFLVNDTNSTETEITLSSNKSSAQNFSLISAQKHHYKLKLYWNTTLNSASCYAGKTGTIGIAANIYQTNK